MIRLAALRLAGLLLTLLLAAVVVFVVTGFAGRDETGLFGWLGSALIGHYGESALLGGPVGGAIAGRLAVTLPLILLATIVALMVGSGLGLLLASQGRGWAALPLRALTYTLAALAPVWLGMMLVLVVALRLKWLPMGGLVPWQQNAGAAFASLILPALAIALPAAAATAIAVGEALTRAQLSNAARGARVRGLTGTQLLWQQSVPIALPAVLRSFAPILAMIVAGALAVEAVFYLPGLGRLMLDAVAARDVPVLRGTVMVAVIISAVPVFAARLAAALLDPERRADAGLAPAPRYRGRRAVLAVAGVILVLALVSFAWTPHAIDRLELGSSLQSPSLTHLLGTDNLGRDILSLAMKALLTGLSVSFIGAVIAGVAGLLLGLLASAFDSNVRRAVLSVPDFLVALPAMALAAVFASIATPGNVPVALAVAITGTPLVARAVCAAVLAAKQRDYVTASRLAGLSTAEAWRRHVLRPVAGVTLMAVLALLPAGLVTEATLSYLGLGAQPPVLSLGTMLRDAQAQMPLTPLPAIVPGLFLLIATVSFAMSVDALRSMRLPRPKVPQQGGADAAA